MMNEKRGFVVTELVLAAVILILALNMILGKHEEKLEKVVVVLQDAEDNQWAALKYGLKMAAEEYEVEFSVVDLEEGASAESQKSIIAGEVENGADALIIQPISANDTKKVLKSIGRKVPVMLIEEEVCGKSGNPLFPVAKANDQQMGKELAEEVIHDFEGNIGAKRIGILVDETDSAVVKKRAEGAKMVLEKSGATIEDISIDAFLWGAYTEEKGNGMDIVVALNDQDLTTLGAYFADNQPQREMLYGVGHSTEAIYYLDKGIVEAVVVPDEFNAGYQSLSEVAKKLNSHFGKMKKQKISYAVIRKETLFTKENQEIILTMSQ